MLAVMVKSFLCTIFAFYLDKINITQIEHLINYQIKLSFSVLSTQLFTKSK